MALLDSGVRPGHYCSKLPQLLGWLWKARPLQPSRAHLLLIPRQVDQITGKLTLWAVRGKFAAQTPTVVSTNLLYRPECTAAQLVVCGWMKSLPTCVLPTATLHRCSSTFSGIQAAWSLQAVYFGKLKTAPWRGGFLLVIGFRPIRQLRRLLPKLSWRLLRLLFWLSRGQALERCLR